METTAHIPVLREGVLLFLDPKPGEVFVDGTVNGGGHARAILARIAPGGTFIGIDWDCDLAAGAEKACAQEAKDVRMIFECASYVEMRNIAARHGIHRADGILLDLGFSSHHTDRSGRGFSFLRDEPLDMRYNTSENRLTAAGIVNDWPEAEIADILWRYGEERFARRIASGIVRARQLKKIASVRELVSVIARSIPRGLPGHVHPATRTFQALRIAVNGELESLERVLPEAVALLAPGGRLAVISFHSLEDRIVKTFMRERESKGVLRLATPKPVRAGHEEIRINPRARSARLRMAIMQSEPL